MTIAAPIRILGVNNSNSPSAGHHTHKINPFSHRLPHLFSVPEHTVGKACPVLFLARQCALALLGREGPATSITRKIRVDYGHHVERE